MKVYSMNKGIKPNTWDVVTTEYGLKYVLLVEFNDHGVFQSVTISNPTGGSAQYFAVHDTPYKFRCAILDTIYRDTIERAKELEDD